MHQQHCSVRLPIVQTQNAPLGACCLCHTSPVASGRDSSQGFLQMMPLLTLFVPSSSYPRRWDADSCGNFYSVCSVFFKIVVRNVMSIYGISGIVRYCHTDVTGADDLIWSFRTIFSISIFAEYAHSDNTEFLNTYFMKAIFINIEETGPLINSASRDIKIFLSKWTCDHNCTLCLSFRAGNDIKNYLCSSFQLYRWIFQHRECWKINFIFLFI